jgi:hypothetical protein
MASGTHCGWGQLSLRPIYDTPAAIKTAIIAVLTLRSQYRGLVFGEVVGMLSGVDMDILERQKNVKPAS